MVWEDGPLDETLPHVRDVTGGQVPQEAAEAGQLVVRLVVEEGRARQGVLWVQEVGRRTVVHDDGPPLVPAQQRHVLDVVTLPQHAALSEEAVGDERPAGVEAVEQRVGVVVHAGGEHDHLKVARHHLHEVHQPRPGHHMHGMHGRSKAHGDNEVCACHGLEVGMHQRLVQVQHQAHFALVLGKRGRQQRHAPARRAAMAARDDDWQKPREGRVRRRGGRRRRRQLGWLA
mmetsp:Transcript_19442/g.74564  ORF Transcript_19442/g.74564 Transcript_19442/m.74564 type:complete len:230 (-) Transcript_19442:722-1411(-)